MEKIFFIDRYANYSKLMFEALNEYVQKNGEYDLKFIGPKNQKLLSQSSKNIQDAREVWSYGDYLEKIFAIVKKEKPKIVHFTFELKTYGPIFSLVKFPILLYRIKKFSKVILTLHNLFVYPIDGKWSIQPYSMYGIPKFVWKILSTIFIKISCKFSDEIIVASNKGKEALVEHYKIPSKKIHVIHMGTSESIKIEKQVFNDDFKNLKIILCFGIISPRKGQETILKAFNQIKEKISNHVLVIAGSAPKEFEKFEKELKDFCARNKIENRVKFLGFVKDENVNELFSMAEMVLYMYKPMASGATALTFALEHEKPIIVSDIDIFKEILDSSNAIFVKHNETELADKILELSNDNNLQIQLSKKIKFVKEKFLWKNFAEKHYKVYTKDL